MARSPDDRADRAGRPRRDRQGFALRWAWRALWRDRVAPAGALLEAGGDIVAGGPAPDGGPSLVGVEDPLGVVELREGTICTSSVAVHHWPALDGRPVHHLIDPATGEPGGDGLLAVTVAAPDPAWAEVWSKALFLASAGRIAGAARARGLAAWWVDQVGRLSMTPAARLLTPWVAGERPG